MSQLKIGDVVAYRAKFLKDIADFSYKSASKRGKITKIEEISKDFIIVEIDGDFGHSVNIKNICKVGSAAFGDNST